MVAPDPRRTTKDNPRYFLSCDWGTSSFRLRLVNIQSAAIVAGISNDQGIKKIYDQWSETKDPRNRIKYYCSFLNQQIDDLQKKCNQHIDGLPLVISGMASSSIGMHELSYGTLPFSLERPDIPVKNFEPTDHFPHAVYLISGLRSSHDIMRGEETELIGLFSATGVSNGRYLLAGTHSKHVTAKNGSVIDFKTHMTGELFGLLSSQSILSNSVAAPDCENPGPAFDEGLAASLNGNILHEFFTIRARDILTHSDPAEHYDYLSGLLIGTELKDIKQKQTGKIVLAGNHQLQKYYAAALHILGLDVTQTDSPIGDDSICLGQITLLHQLRN